MQRFLSVDPLAEDYASWSPYNYVLGNPILLTDPDGEAPVCETCKKFLGATISYFGGVGNAIVSNFTGNAPGTRLDPQDWGAGAEYAKMGQKAGDIFSVAIGTVEQVAGVVATISGGVAAPETGGLSLTVSAAGTQAVVHGTTMSQAAIQNLLGGNQVNMSSDDGDKINLDDFEDLNTQPFNERMDKGGGNNRPRNNQVQNSQTNSLSKKYNLTKEQRNQLHRRIKGEDLDYKGLEEIIKNEIIKD